VTSILTRLSAQIAQLHEGDPVRADLIRAREHLLRAMKGE
jgi:hypothetical protein